MHDAFLAVACENNLPGNAFAAAMSFKLASPLNVGGVATSGALDCGLRSVAA